MGIRDIFSLFHRGVTRFPLTAGREGFNPVMVQRPLINAGDTARYFLDAQQVPVNSPVGGGTLPLGNAPGLPRNALAVSPQAVGEQAHGTIPQTPGTGGLMPGFRYGSI